MSVQIAEALFEKRVTHVGKIILNRAGLLTALKNVKDRQLESSIFMWKEKSPVMGVSYHPKKGYCWKVKVYINKPRSNPKTGNFYFLDQNALEPVKTISLF